MPEPPANAPPIPLSRLGELDGWHITIQCGKCRRRVMLPVPQLAEKHGPDLAVWRLVARLRCRSQNRSGAPCRARPNRVTLVQGRERRKDFLVYREVMVLDDRAPMLN